MGGLCRIIAVLQFLPYKVCETSGQVHCRRTAAENGEDALQVEQLQELVIAEEHKNNLCNTDVRCQAVSTIIHFL